jgi:hypothetical protein
VGGQDRVHIEVGRCYAKLGQEHGPILPGSVLVGGDDPEEALDLGDPATPLT